MSLLRETSELSTTLSHCFECGRQLQETHKNCRFCGTDHPAGVQCFLCGEKLPQSQAVLARQLRHSGYCHEYCLTESMRSLELADGQFPERSPEPHLSGTKTEKPTERPQDWLPKPGRSPVSPLSLTVESRPLATKLQNTELHVQVRQSQWPHQSQSWESIRAEEEPDEIARVFAKPTHTRRRDATRILRPNHYRTMMEKLRQDIKHSFRFRPASQNRIEYPFTANTNSRPTNIWCLYIFASTVLSCICFALGSSWGGFMFVGLALYYLCSLLKVQ
jgi:hypothetical protein